MQLGITIAQKGQTFEVLVGPEVSFNEQRRNFRKLRAGLTGFDEVQLWSSGSGRVKRYRFKSKVVAPAVPTEVSKKDTASSEPAAPAPIVIDTNSADSAPAKKAGKKKKS